MSEPTWSERRLTVAEKWGAVAKRFGSPASAFEISGAVAADQKTDLSGIPGDRAAYDRRALLNVLAVLLDDSAVERVRAEYQRFYDFVGDSDPALVDAWHFTENVRVQQEARDAQSAASTETTDSQTSVVSDAKTP